MTDPGPDPPPPTRRTFALFVLGVLAFTLYGSLVPLEYRPRPWGEVADSFAWAMANRVALQSRSDGLANVMLGVPLGFGLLGMVRVDRDGRRARDGLAGVLLLPACVGFAAAVEFAQLYFPARTCAGSDVLCQGFGAALGMAGWVLFGRGLTAEARAVWGRVGGAAGRLLVGYLALLAFVQALPLDLSPSPKDLYVKVRDRVTLVPFGEFRGGAPARNWNSFLGRGGVPDPGRTPEVTSERAWGQAAKLLKLAGLYLPAGLLAARLTVRPGLSRVVVAAAGLACVLEAGQLFVQSRTPSATDVVVGAAAALVGWAMGRLGARFRGDGRHPLPLRERVASGAQRREPGEGSGEEPLTRAGLRPACPLPQGERGKTVGAGLVPGLSLLLGIVWAAVLVAAYWEPFDFRGPPAAFDRLPGMPLESGNPLDALEELLTKAVLFAPFGALAGRRWLGVAVGAAVAAGIEAGQLYLPTHSPGITDVIVGGLGALAGAWVAARLGEPGASATGSALGGNLRPGVY